ncbi:MAG: CHAP domain-containing protein [Alphaproteobacteria bacterium]|nr:CHAP domain-containing protein [Alphaproteobacteria bacterium]
MRRFFFLGLALALGACSTARPPFSNQYAAGYGVSEAVSCVPYARGQSGIPIRGDAYTWWSQAVGRYARGNIPHEGAVYVLAKTPRLTRGHLSVVTRVLDPRTIEVTHSNWGSDRATRSVIYERMRVEDISPANDWTLARFWNYEANSYGRPYEAYGFIYPR